ncbi:MAG: radical SAM protein [Deltaproteobacteria bacterium]|nr:radical SAM protein [Deltaproteobacteria bacterium]
MRIDTRNLYRLPWSVNDNPIGWLEVTDKCNIVCKGCYREELEGHRPLDVLEEEVRRLKELRNPDSICIAGGEPLLHPQICDIVAYVNSLGLKAAILTNAVNLDENLARELKRAGVYNLKLHIDQWQSRPHHKRKTEVELMDLRQSYVELLRKVGGIDATFGATVYRENLQYVGDILAWAQKNIDVVSGLIFLTFRAVPTGGEVELYAGGKRVDPKELRYSTNDATEVGITAADVLDSMRRVYPDVRASSFLGGTMCPDTPKWLLLTHIASSDRSYGFVGPRTMELAQTFHHAVFGKYLTHGDRPRLGPGYFGLSAIDPAVRPGLRRWATDLARRPWRLFDRTLTTQSVLILQGPDHLEDGTVDMCDSCPDMAFFEGKLYPSCRLDELRKWGTLANAHHTDADARRRAESARQKLPIAPPC